MAEPVSREECVRRHRAYHIDIGPRLGGRGSLQRRRIEAMVRSVRPGDRVLDVGCNTGYLVDFLPDSCEVHGVDVASDLVAQAARRLKHARVAEAERLPYLMDSFDVVVLGEILEHVFDPVAVLREAARVSRRLVVGSTPHEAGKWGPNGKNKPEGHRFHVRCYTADSLIDDLLAAGLREYEIETVSDGDGVRQMYVFAANVP